MATGRDPLDFETPEEEREFQIYYAKVMMREAMARRGTRFSFTLLEWAGKARRRAHELSAAAPIQGELF